MKILQVENGPFAVNTYIIHNDATNEALILDPGQGLSQIEGALQKTGATPVAILATHGHIDHVAGVNSLKTKYNIPFYMNIRDRDLLDAIPMQSKMFGVANPGIPEIDSEIPDSGYLELAGFNIGLHHTPGHSAGSISFFIDNVLLCGDVLFNLSIGRTDLPGGNYGTLISSIRNSLFSFPDDTKVKTGHGPDTTIGYEKKNNPFLN